MTPLLRLHSKLQLPSSIRRADIREEQPFFKFKERKTPHISPPNLPKRLIFYGYVVQLWVVYQLAQKGTIFAILVLQHPLPQTWA